MSNSSGSRSLLRYSLLPCQPVPFTQVLGKLSPGRQLTRSQWLLVRYRVFQNLQRGSFYQKSKGYLHSTVLANPVMRMLGAKTGYDSTVDGITGALMCMHGL